MNCGDFCSCTGLTDNVCHFGPDDKGQFVTRTVTSELADSCDREFCVCDHHIQEDEEDTFESILEERYDIAADRTIKAHEDPPDAILPLYLKGEGEAFERFGQSNGRSKTI